MTALRSLYLCMSPLWGDARKISGRAAKGGTWPYIMSGGHDIFIKPNVFPLKGPFHCCGGENTMKEKKHPIKGGNTLLFAAIGGTIIALVLIFGTIWMGHSARRSTEEAVHSVSDFYLQELA